ncbi:MAG: hypothetical protein ACF8QF_05145 [Phycisphaerales bacterium]
MNRTSTLLAFVIGAAAVATTLSGCIGFHGPNDLKRSVARAGDVRLKQDFGISTNGMTLRMARGLASPWVDEPLPRLAGIKRAQVGTYRIEAADGPLPASILADLEVSGWEAAVRVTNPAGADETLVLVKEDRKGRLRGVAVAARDGEELTLARVRGNLEKFLANVLADDAFGIDIPYIGTAKDEVRNAARDAREAQENAGVRLVPAAADEPVNPGA